MIGHNGGPGAPRGDLQKLRKIGASGKGWVDRLEAARKRGEYLPGVGLATGGLLTYGALRDDDRGSY